MSKSIIILVIAFCCISQIAAQTFQYSRGWTNGKRSSASAASPTDLPQPFRQMMPNSLLMTASELNNRERLFQHIIKNPCDVRMALMLASHNGFKLPNDDFSPSAADILDEDALNRFKRELGLHN